MASGCFGAVESDMGLLVIAGCLGMAQIAGLVVQGSCWVWLLMLGVVAVRVIRHGGGYNHNQ